MAFVVHHVPVYLNQWNLYPRNLSLNRSSSLKYQLKGTLNRRTFASRNLNLAQISKITTRTSPCISSCNINIQLSDNPFGCKVVLRNRKFLVLFDSTKICSGLLYTWISPQKYVVSYKITCFYIAVTKFNFILVQPAPPRNVSGTFVNPRTIYYTLKGSGTKYVQIY